MARKAVMESLDLKSGGGLWIDGLTTSRSYCVIGTLEKEADGNKIAVRKVGNDFYKIKFYPNVEYWLIEPNNSRQMGKLNLSQRLDGTHDHRRGYDRFYTNDEGLKAIIDHLSTLQDCSHLSTRSYKSLYVAKYEDNIPKDTPAYE